MFTSSRLLVPKSVLKFPLRSSRKCFCVCFIWCGASITMHVFMCASFDEAVHLTIAIVRLTPASISSSVTHTSPSNHTDHFITATGNHFLPVYSIFSIIFSAGSEADNLEQVSKFMVGLTEWVGTLKKLKICCFRRKVLGLTQMFSTAKPNG